LPRPDAGSANPPEKEEITMPFSCSICGEESIRICVRCTKDACDNHLCEKCRKCSDCCECEVALAPHPPESVREALHPAVAQAEAVVGAAPAAQAAAAMEAPPAMEAASMVEEAPLPDPPVEAVGSVLAVVEAAPVADAEPAREVAPIVEEALPVGVEAAGSPPAVDETPNESAKETPEQPAHEATGTILP
jgi:hypothetical protein